MNKFTLALVAIIFLFVFTGCGASPEPVEITIEMTEFAFTPDAIELKVGQEVTLNLVNRGALSHEFMVGQTALKSADAQFVQYEHDFFHHIDPIVTRDGEPYSHDGSMSGTGSTGHDMSGDHAMDDHGFMVGLPGNAPDSTTTITFTITKDMVGEWEMGCFLDGGSHYISGMAGKIVVSP